eukprot:3191544-Rhodomonas_salina.1
MSTSDAARGVLASSVVDASRCGPAQRPGSAGRGAIRVMSVPRRIVGRGRWHVPVTCCRSYWYNAVRCCTSFLR